MENKQAIQKRIEHIIIDWAIHWMLFFVQGLDNFITAIERERNEWVIHVKLADQVNKQANIESSLIKRK